MKFNNSKSQQKFGLNIISNIGAFAISMLIVLWFTPYLIRNLGIAAYGLVPLANSVTSYMSIITLSLNGAVGRFLTIDIQKNDLYQANRTFNTALIGSLGLSLVSLPIVVGIGIYAPKLFNVPIGNESATQLLFIFVMFSFLITTIESCFSVSSWAKRSIWLKCGL